MTGVFRGESLNYAILRLVNLSHNPLLSGTVPCISGVFDVRNTSIVDLCQTRSTVAPDFSDPHNLESSFPISITNLVFIAAGCVVFLILCITVIGCIVFRTRKNRKSTKSELHKIANQTELTTNTSKENKQESLYVPMQNQQQSPITLTESQKAVQKQEQIEKALLKSSEGSKRNKQQLSFLEEDENSIIRKYVIDWNDIQLEQRIGEGNFGEVWLGKFECFLSNLSLILLLIFC